MSERVRAVSRRRSAQFYRVSTSRLAVLQLVTFGLYAVYWFYRHWAVQRRARRLDISPLARGIFAIFFAHRLFELIDQGARATGISPRWKHGSQATLYVLLAIVAHLLKSSGQTFVVSFALNVLTLLPLTAAQRLANLANGHTLLVAEDDDEDERP